MAFNKMTILIHDALMKTFTVIVVVSAFFCCSGNKSGTNLSTESGTNLSTEVSDVSYIEEVEKKLELKGINRYGIWKLSEKPKDRLYYFIGVDKDEPDSEVLSILDTNETLLLRESAIHFDKVFTFYILREDRPQLIIPSINYGGSGRFFKVLDYRDGKVINLNDEDDALYSGDFTILPQYQEKRYFELPYQVLLTENAASEDAEATILRYLDGKYVSAGKVSQRDLWVGKTCPSHSR
ncbi:MAG: hypothetical protein H0U23_09235 [Blastocatellia bacterium]|nr:hypothetical protein [Blastocatellia bacterium]